MGTRALVARVPYFWLFLELTFSPNLLPALASGMALGAGVGEGAACLPTLPCPPLGIGWRAAQPALIPCPGFPCSSAPEPALLEQGGLFFRARSCEQRKIFLRELNE